MVSTMYIGGVETVDPRIMSIQVTTVGAATFTIQDLTIDTGKTEIVDWGDGSRNSYTGSGSRSHAYAGAGTWTVRFNYPTAILALDIRDSKAYVTLSELGKATNILVLLLFNCRVDGDSSDLSALRPNDVALNSLSASSVLTFDSADLSNWRPSNGLSLSTLPVSCSVVMNSADLTNWRPVSFYLINLLSISGAFNSSDLTAWRPDSFELFSLAGMTGTFDSADLVAWRPLSFIIVFMPVGFAFTLNSSDAIAWRPVYFHVASNPGLSGAFNSSDLTAWPVTQFFTLFDTPVGFSVNFDSADLAAWRPVGYALVTILTLTTTFTPGGFSGWITTDNFNMYATGLTQAKVDQILADFYAAFATRTASGGTMEISGNAAPSGVYQAQCPPTTGKEYKYELLNDSCTINPTKVWTTINTA